MKKRTISKTLLAAIAVAMLGTGCGEKSGKPQSAKTGSAAAAANPLTIVLAYRGGTNRTDTEIRQRQEQIRAGTQTDIALERLGWLYVAKARESFDAGFYKLAEQCALVMERGYDASSQQSGHGDFAANRGKPQSGDEGVAATRSAAMLLRAHVLQNLHRFQESEVVARELVIVRGLAFDFGVLGDALMEQGKLDEAVAAYQHMADLRPDSQVLTRAAHIRWLKGDLAGAIEMMEFAASAVGTRETENAAWVFTRTAALRFQQHPDSAKGARDCETALALHKDYPPTMLLRGKILLARNKFAEAVEVLRLAEKHNPLPEYQWALADALDAAGLSAEAQAVEARLLRTGASADPRSFALFLATRGGQSTLALRLAREELATRADVFTYDALAWAQFSAGDYSAAWQSMERALAEGTQDARLFMHAANIAAKAGQTDRAEQYFHKADALSHLLLPSERKQLCTVAPQWNSSGDVAISSADREASSAGGKSF